MAPSPTHRPWFEPLVRTFEGPALRFALMMVRDRSTAEEIVQEAFAQVWASPKTPSQEVDFRRWLYRSISNLAADQARRQHRFARIPIWPKPPENPLDAVDRWMADQELVAVLRELSTRERLAIYLRYYEDQDFTDIDQMLESHPGTGRKLVARALVKLRKRLAARATEDAMA